MYREILIWSGNIFIPTTGSAEFNGNFANFYVPNGFSVNKMRIKSLQWFDNDVGTQAPDRIITATANFLKFPLNKIFGFQLSSAAGTKSTGNLYCSQEFDVVNVFPNNQFTLFLSDIFDGTINIQLEFWYCYDDK